MYFQLFLLVILHSTIGQTSNQQSTDKKAQCYSKFVDSQSTRLTFEQMRSTKVTIEQLHSWSAKPEVIKRYQSYLNNPKQELNEEFYICSSKNCESKTEEEETTPRCTPTKCQRNGKSSCLNKNKKVNCYNDHDGSKAANGLCISSEQNEEDDFSDWFGEPSTISSYDECYRNPAFGCEERRCPPHMFPCGDGQCIHSNGVCSNGRHLLLRQTKIDEKIFAEKCRKTIKCQHQLSDKVDGIECKQWLADNPMTPVVFEQCKKLVNKKNKKH